MVLYFQQQRYITFTTLIIFKNFYEKIKGSQTIANELHGIDPWDVEFGMPLTIVFKPKEERIGAVTDFHFEAADSWKPLPMNEEKQRIQKLVEPVYEWVKTLR